MLLTFNWLTFLSLWCLALFCFLSNSLMALHHILLAVPGIYLFVKNIKSLKLSKSALFLGLLIIFVIASVLFNWSQIPHPGKNLARTKYFILGFLAIFAFRENLKSFLTKKRIKYLLSTFIVTTTFASLVGIISMFTKYNFIRMKTTDGTRTQGMYGMVITYGHGIALACILLATLIFFRKEIKEYIAAKWLWLAFIVNFAGLYLSYTRGALLGFIFGLLSLLWFKNKKIFVTMLTLLIVILGITTWITQNKDLGSRYLMDLSRSTNTRRVSQIITTYYMVIERPLLGFGFRNYQDASVAVKKRHDVILSQNWSAHAHNNYLEILGGCGILAFLCLLLWHGFWLRESFGSAKTYSKLFGPFLVTWIVSGLTQSSIIDGENMFLIMAIYALSQIKNEDQKRFYSKQLTE